MSEWKWAILAAAVFIAAILFCALPVSAQGAIRVHGIVQDADTYEAVPGGHIWLERQWVGVWFKMLCCESDPMQGHAFGWDLTQPGRYRVRWAKAGYEVVWIRSGEFDLATAPFGDILISVRRMTGPTATPSATAEPTATRTTTPRPTFPVPTTGSNAHGDADTDASAMSRFSAVHTRGKTICHCHSLVAHRPSA
jgi:hypothetical protein